MMIFLFTLFFSKSAKSSRLEKNTRTGGGICLKPQKDTSLSQWTIRLGTNRCCIHKLFRSFWYKLREEREGGRVRSAWPRVRNKKERMRDCWRYSSIHGALRGRGRILYLWAQGTIGSGLYRSHCFTKWWKEKKVTAKILSVQQR